MDSSWTTSSNWYHTLVSKEGHYYHKKIIIPKTLALLNPSSSDRILDLACGQGVLARSLPSKTGYLGIDGAQPLINFAKKNSKHRFLCRNLAKPLDLKETFTHAAIILALQNISDPQEVLYTAAKHLEPNGRLVMVLNHPCFRIPRQSSWGVDEEKKIQYRRVDTYMSERSIPIQTSPGKKERSEITMSYHYPLHAIAAFLHKAGFVITEMEEWCSDKTSTGKKAKMENRARQEFPLFLTILCRQAVTG